MADSKNTTGAISAPGLMLVYKEVILPKFDPSIYSTITIQKQIQSEQQSITGGDKIDSGPQQQNVEDEKVASAENKATYKSTKTNESGVSGQRFKVRRSVMSSRCFVWNNPNKFGEDGFRIDPFDNWNLTDRLVLHKVDVPFKCTAQNVGAFLVSVYNGYNGRGLCDQEYPDDPAWKNPDPTQAYKDIYNLKKADPNTKDKAENLAKEEVKKVLKKNSFYYAKLNLISSRNCGNYPNLDVRCRLQLLIPSPALYVKSKVIQTSKGNWTALYVDIPKSSFGDTIYVGNDTKYTTIEVLKSYSDGVGTVRKGQFYSITNARWGGEKIKFSDIRKTSAGKLPKLDYCVGGVYKAILLNSITDSIFKDWGSEMCHGILSHRTKPNMDNSNFLQLPVLVQSERKVDGKTVKDYVIDPNIPYGHTKDRVYLNPSFVNAGDYVRVFYFNEWTAITKPSQVYKNGTEITFGQIYVNDASLVGKDDTGSSVAILKTEQYLSGLVVPSRVMKPNDTTKKFTDYIEFGCGYASHPYKDKYNSSGTTNTGTDTTSNSTSTQGVSGAVVVNTVGSTVQYTDEEIFVPEIQGPQYRYYELDFGAVANPRGSIQQAGRFGFGIQGVSYSSSARKSLQQTRGIVGEANDEDAVRGNMFSDTFWVGPDKITLSGIIEMPHAVDVKVVTTVKDQPGTEGTALDDVGTPYMGKPTPKPMSFKEAVENFYLWNAHPYRVNRGEELWLFDFSIIDDSVKSVKELKAYKVSLDSRSWNVDTGQPNLLRFTLNFTVLEKITPPMMANAAETFATQPDETYTSVLDNKDNILVGMVNSAGNAVDLATKPIKDIWNDYTKYF